MGPEKLARHLATVSALLLLAAVFHRAQASEPQQPQDSPISLLQGPAQQLFGLDLGAPLELPIYQIGKRARKMSAFMPMRGRKDGRDEQQLVQFRELDPDSPSILRLVAGGGGGGGQRLTGPRQFAVSLRRAADGPAAGADEPIMEAKLRRAFHPMRGKKWAPAGELSGPELAYEEQLELGEV